MHDDENSSEIPLELERYLALCQRIYERMEGDGSWPWADSRKSEDLIESEGNSPTI